MSMRLADAIDQFLAWLAPRKLSSATMHAYRRDLSGVSGLLAERLNKQPEQLTLAVLTKDNMRLAFSTFTEDHAKASILRAHSTWNQFFDFLVADGLVEGNPMAAINRPKEEMRKPKPLQGWEDDTAARLLRSMAAGERGGRNLWPERDVAVVATLLATGVRSSELTNMNIGSIEGRHGEQVVHVIGKGSKPRSIPIEPALDQLLGTYIESRKSRFPTWRSKGSDPLFVSGRSTTADDKQGGRRMSPKQLYWLLDQGLKAAGLGSRREPGVMAHAFRHTYGTTLAADGAPVAAIRKLMGHSSINTSQGYIDSLAREEREFASRNRVYEVLEKLDDPTDD